MQWADITPLDMDVLEVSFLPEPLQIPTLMAGSGQITTSPKVTMRIKVALARDTLRRGLLRPEQNIVKTFITSFDLDDE